VLLAVLAHIAAGGGSPSMVTLGLAVLPVGWTAAVLTRRRRGLLWVAGALGALQLVLHEGLMVMTAGTGCAAPAAPMGAGMTGHPIAVACSMSGQATTGTAFGARQMPGSGGLTMLVAHVLATIATGWLLYRGEQTAWALVDLARRLAVPALGTAFARPTFPSRRWFPDACGFAAAGPRQSVEARAPPRVAALAAA
jgi:hypothetical protein